MKKQFIIFLITYIITKLIGGATGIYFNFLSGQFDLILLLKDFGIWVITYTIVALLVSRIYKKSMEKG